MRGASCKAGRTLAAKWERQTTRKLEPGNAAAVLRSAVRDHIRGSASDPRRSAPCRLFVAVLFAWLAATSIRSSADTRPGGSEARLPAPCHRLTYFE